MWNSLQEPDLLKFLLTRLSGVENFMSLISEPRRVWLFGYAFCGRFVPKDNVDQNLINDTISFEESAFMAV